MDKVYLDHAATTYLDSESKRKLEVCLQLGNASSFYAKEAKILMQHFRTMICKYLGVTLWDGDGKNLSGYAVIFTSGATEANCTILRMIVDGYKRLDPKGETRPHIIISAVEHSAFLRTATHLAECGYVDVAMVSPDKYGFISKESVSAAIRDNTILVCVMHANNETGGINDIAGIAKVCHDKGIPLHSDCVQSFGRMTLPAQDLDSLSVSFHKFGGLQGSGALIVSVKFLSGYELSGMIDGSQNYGLRGGTENLPGLFTGYFALEHTLREKDNYRKHITMLRKHLLERLRKALPCRFLSELYSDETHKKPIELIILQDSGRNALYLPNILLISVVKWSESPPIVCNVDMRKELYNKGYTVSIGSACSTGNPHASHILTEMGASREIKRGTLRISLGVKNTTEELDGFVKELTEIFKKYAAMMK